MYLIIYHGNNPKYMNKEKNTNTNSSTEKILCLSLSNPTTNHVNLIDTYLV